MIQILNVNIWELLESHEHLISYANQATNRKVYVSSKARFILPSRDCKIVLYAPITIGPNVKIHLQEKSALYISQSSLEGEVLIAVKTLRAQNLTDITVHASTQNVQILGANTLSYLTLGSNVQILGKNTLTGYKSGRITHSDRACMNLENQSIHGEQVLTIPKIPPVPNISPFTLTPMPLDLSAMF